ncbi:hypothetical protein LO763_01270 [Glycomyces sp. A-F 0318]|uniref:hypothetical protein n=1 Tax=Glycomyces amatae TaxID=2881355 RepID=UPI001E580403|nr:hypothetical protein [Glycomyces amatae]MCD0442255.1 hypothetical protein [Glycomyces amatae]
MSYPTLPEIGVPENRPTPSQGSLSRYVFRTSPYDQHDPGPWLWKPDPDYRRDLRTGRHRRDEAPDPLPTVKPARPRPYPVGPAPGLDIVLRPAVSRLGAEPLPGLATRPGAAIGEGCSDPAPVDPFERLREDAWTRFLECSASLAAAHTARRRPSLLTRVGATLKRAVRRAVSTARFAPSPS